MLQIVVDKSIEDKYRDSFVRALMREAETQETECRVLDTYGQAGLDKVDWTVPTVVTEPKSYEVPRKYNNADENTTAKVIAAITRGNRPMTVLLINRSKLIGKPLINMLLEQDHTVTVAHSKTPVHKIAAMVQDAEVLITATGHELKYIKSIDNIVTIDVSNDISKDVYIDSFEYYSMSDIGKLTVKKIVENSKDVIKNEYN